MLRRSSPLQSPPSEIKFYGVDMGGNAFFVKLGEGLRIRFTGTEVFLDATPVPAPPPPPAPAPLRQKISVRRLQPDVAGNYVVGADVAIVRNGLVMLLDYDYIHNGEGVLPKESWAGDDVYGISLAIVNPENQ
jgi:hypothetical protein